jgi:hypothetical protein
MIYEQSSWQPQSDIRIFQFRVGLDYKHKCFRLCNPAIFYIGYALCHLANIKMPISDWAAFTIVKIPLLFDITKFSEGILKFLLKYFFLWGIVVTFGILFK